MTWLRRDLLVAFFAVTIFLCLIPILTYIHFASDLAPRETLINHNDQGIKLFDSKSRLFFTFYDAKLKKEVPLSNIPKVTQQAIIAMEDKDFYSHPGFSITAMIRAFFEDIQGKQLTYGASTITQQLVKNSLLNPRKDFLRKAQEIVLSQELERRYTKNQILEMYLNSVYFGEGSFGVEEAADIYFNKHAKDLNLAQSAILAAVLPAPSRLSLLNGDLTEAKRIQALVLDKMVEQKYITPEQKDEALKEDIGLDPHQNDLNATAPHFALMVRDQLIKQYGEEVVARSGFKVKTTLDLDWQKYAEKSVARQVENLRFNNVSNGSAVVMDPKTSEVKALVGSKDWNNSSFGKVNIAVSLRSPGSAFKPIVYIRAFEENFLTPATILQDEPTRFANFDEKKFFARFPTRAAALYNLANDPNAYYRPVDYDRRYRGPVTVRRALSNSLNIPAVSVLQKIGVPDALDSAKNLGITTLGDPENYGLALVLGTGEVKLLELTNAYAVFANKGYRNEPTLILEIADKKGNLIYKYQPNPTRVVDEKYTFLISSILSDNKARAEVFGTALNISRPAAVKTGTAEEFKDAWTIGYTPSLVVGVWVGNNYNEPMDGVAGSLGAAPIWQDLMEKFLKGTPIEQFTPPEGIVKIPTCGSNPVSKIATSSAAFEYFVKGTEPLKNCLTNTATPSAAVSPASPPTPTSSGTTYIIITPSVTPITSPTTTLEISPAPTTSSTPSPT
ncbi:MAG: PBP1A family penicillin-binding protein [Patescibacteria group bacterium]|nr:PBP1A family penicillin-binding protein [Patescibacteria group bacterium]